ncbi:hypothetical protein GW17_00036649 [Ensete ventricosum]|nr:hypothetical protein GW17_00036649 [Ensete ventricosum]
MWQQRIRHVEVYEPSPSMESKSEGFVDLTFFSNREAGTATGLPTRPSSAGEVTTRWTAEGRREAMRTRRADADGYGARSTQVRIPILLDDRYIMGIYDRMVYVVIAGAYS